MIHLRAVTEKDLPFIEKVYRSTREKGLDMANWPELRKEAFFRMQSVMQDAEYKHNFPNAVFEIIEDGKKPVGRLYTAETENEIWVIDISLLSEFRGKGIGSKVLQGIMAKVADQQKILSLHVEPNNPAYRLYLKLGFKYLKSNGRHYHMEYKP
jgi:ribosomal protein S18 acetylase RimI-like enzyme